MDMTPDLARLERILRGERCGFTRDALAQRLGMGDRAARALVEEAVATGWLPIIPDRSAGGEAKYRLLMARETDELNRQNREDITRAASIYKRAKGRTLGMERLYGPNMFNEPVPADMDAA